MSFIVGDLRFSMWIPSELAGLVVGKKGSTISTIQQETKTKLLEARKPLADSLWSPVIIHGDPAHVLAAFNAVAKIVDNEVDDVVAEFLIDRKKHGFLLGYKGAQLVKVFSAQTNVRIYVPDKEAFQPPPPGERPKLVHGTLEGRCEDVFRLLGLLDREYTLSLDRATYAAATSTLAVLAAASKGAANKTPNPVPSSSAPQPSKPSTLTPVVVEEKQPVVDSASAPATDPIPAVLAPDSRDKAVVVRSVFMPVPLLGLVMSSRPVNAGGSVLNRIQRATGTRISRAKPPRPQSENSVAGASETVAAPEAPSESARRRKDDDEDEDEEAEEAVDDSVQAMTPPVAETSPETEEPVEFLVSGPEEGVAQVERLLARIVQGERIKDVLAGIAAVPRRGERGGPIRGRGRGRGSGRERDEDATRKPPKKPYKRHEASDVGGLPASEP